MDVTGTPGDDVIVAPGWPGSGIVDALGGNDTIAYSSGYYTVHGGAGNDRLVVSTYNTSSTTFVTIDSGTLSGGYAGSARLPGGEAADFDGIENFTVYTGPFEDVLLLRGGNNIVDTGLGDDLLSMDLSSATSAILLDLKTNTSVLPGGGSISDVEALSDFRTGSGNDTVVTGDFFYSHGINTGAGDDSVSIRAGSVTGGAGVDTLIADPFAIPTIPISAFTGSLATGYSGVFGTVSFSGFENFVLASGADNDRMRIGDGVDRIQSGAGNDTVDTAGGNDTIQAGAGNDALIGGAGADVLDGGADYDYARYDFAASGVTANLGNAALNTGEAAGDSFLSIEGMVGSRFADTLVGDGGSNDLAGLGGNDTMRGAAGDDVVQGMDGDDTLDGGAGFDRLVGGSGNDVFILRAGEMRSDAIGDFAGNGAAAGDQLRFEGYGTAAQGATLTQMSSTRWSINSFDGTLHDILVLANAAPIHAADYTFV